MTLKEWWELQSERNKSLISWGLCIAVILILGALANYTITVLPLPHAVPVNLTADIFNATAVQTFKLPV